MEENDKKYENMHPVDEYAQKVIDGVIPSCQFVIQACERHIRDLERDDIWFDYDHAEYVCDYFPVMLTLTKGKDANKPFVLELWQKFIVGSLFGWKKKGSDLRRYKTAHIEIPKKNGKTELMAGIALYMLEADGEAGAEVYSGATGRDQASIVWDASKVMVKKNKEWFDSSYLRIVATSKSIVHDESNSLFRPLSADANTLDGKNVHCAIIDELHQHKTAEVYDTILNGRVSRTQPMGISITTAGDDKYSIAYEIRDYVTKILDGVLEDDSFFGIIFTIDEKDDWMDESNHIKANPNWNVSVFEEFISDQFKKATQIPTFQNVFKRFHLNQWTDSTTAWISDGKWSKCDKGQVDLSSLKHKRCFVGMDLSSTSDITAIVCMFMPEEEKEDWIMIPYFFVPAHTLTERSKEDKVPYDIWEKDGFLFKTEGDTIDYRQIREFILDDLALKYNIEEIDYDRYHSTALINELMDNGIECVPIAQSITQMSAPTKELERLVLSNELNHMGNPVMRWMMSNVEIYTDANENYKPVKGRNQKKRIDGVIASIMALARGMIVREEQKSIYEERGLLIL